MLRIECSGSPHEIGLKHGTEAREAISRCIAFYAKQFKQNAGKEWHEVQEIATKFEPVIQSRWPSFLEEMGGIAEGAQVPLIDIIAINVRTEVTFGLWNQAKSTSDGCTALFWKTNDAMFLAQNWDWMENQKKNLVLLTIRRQSKPTIKMVTEAGLIGKIGLNSAGVGVCLNAIRIPGLNVERIPCHLGLRLALESESAKQAIDKLKGYGVASACHYLLADSEQSVGLEWSSSDVQEIQSRSDKIFHTNHYIVEHPGVTDIPWLDDSSVRLAKIEELSNTAEKQSLASISRMLSDESSFPTSICRAQKDASTFATLFSIVMDLSARKAVVKVGRPIAPEEVIELAF
ncbi:Acyl-coenzyme A:6-aminopenicillanic-acid-acyltransferase 40 kDa form [Pseudocercospora fuligena]|uniref:Acyl-coenzyme A:6-aminopenicillanic-acid-acyltransferase 40 kDa form n=1 Tax=Pseudocercospora fuligena TaxID=685502 RepID=A0A8H6R8E5_9PEZI|nr:Acyl-coenzyme A:6-aminopenicillanic-acid-acyltransferase 40 kDa form [Pseudocercospora fuligena]